MIKDLRKGDIVLVEMAVICPEPDVDGYIYLNSMTAYWDDCWVAPSQIKEVVKRKPFDWDKVRSGDRFETALDGFGTFVGFDKVGDPVLEIEEAFDEFKVYLKNHAFKQYPDISGR